MGEKDLTFRIFRRTSVLQTSCQCILERSARTRAVAIELRGTACDYSSFSQTTVLQNKIN